MRVRVVLGSLLLATTLAGGAWLALRPGGGGPGLEADAGAEEDVPRDAAAGTLAAYVRPEVVGVTGKVARGRIEGDVRRAGAGVAARVTLFQVAKSDPGTAPAWAIDANEPFMPTEESLALAPLAGVDADAEGHFAFGDVPAGTYDLVARGATGGAGSARVVVACDRALSIARVELRGGGPERLTGRAHHADGRPFRGLVVPFGNEYPFVFPRAATPVVLDDEGRFTLTGLDPGPICVVAYVPGSFLVRSHVVVLPSAVELDLVVDAGLEEARGRVVADKDGQPVAGAVVVTSFTDLVGAAIAEARAVTDGDGRFRIAAERGLSDYTVVALGFAPLKANRRLAQGDGFELRLVHAGRVVGRVTSKVDGAPVEGVTVYVVDGADAAGPHAVTKPDGRYEITDVVPGDVVVVASGAGWISDGFRRATGHFNPFTIPLEPGAVATVDLVVVKGSGAHGVVLDGAGKPAAGAHVEAVRRLPGNADDAVFGFLAEAQAVATGPDGRFALDALVADATYEFHATHPSASEAKVGPLRVEADKPTEVELRLGAARFADVAVRLKSGGPVAGITVYASSDSDEGSWNEHGHGNTGANGLVRLGPLPAGPLSFGIWSDDGYACDDATEGGPEGSTDPIRVELLADRSYAIAGTVGYVDGTPLEGSVVELAASDIQQNAWIGRSGAFRFTGLAAGTYELRVKLDWGAEPVETVSAKAGDVGLAIVVKVPRKDQLEVCVLDADGRPVGRGSYVFMCGGSSENGGYSDGRFRVGAPTAEWSVFAYRARSTTGAPAPSGSLVAGPFAASVRSQEIRLPPERRIEGVVRAPDGHGVRGVRVAANFLGLPAPFEQTNDEASSARTDDQGRFRLGGLGAGSYRLRVSVGGGFGAIDPVEIASGTTDVVLTLKVGDAIAPLVLDADGKPLIGVFVKATGPLAASVSDTDGEGRAALEGLDAQRTYELVVEAPPSRTDVLSLTLAAWKPSNDPIQLARAYRIAGVVRDPDGRPVADASVNAVGSDSDAHSATTRGNGTFEVLRVPAGAVTVWAEGEGDPPRRSRAVRSTAGATDVALVLETTTSVVVRLASSRPLPNEASVCVHDANGLDDWESVQPDHAATFRNLQPSSIYTFAADVEPGDGSPHLVGIARGVRGDAKALTLDLVEGRALSGRLRFPVGTTELRVTVTTDGEHRVASADEDGRFVVEGLFEGPCDVAASGESADGRTLESSTKAVAGGTVELELRAAR